VLIRRPAFPSTFSTAALAVSAAIDCEHVDPAARELCNASGPEEKKTLERQIKDKDEANTGENTAESYRWSTAELPHC
jgi:hypothetical protein